MMCDRFLVISVVFCVQRMQGGKKMNLSAHSGKINKYRVENKSELTPLGIFIYFARLSREGLSRIFLFLGNGGV